MYGLLSIEEARYTFRLVLFFCCVVVLTCIFIVIFFFRPEKFMEKSSERKKSTTRDATASVSIAVSPNEQDEDERTGEKKKLKGEVAGATLADGTLPYCDGCEKLLKYNDEELKNLELVRAVEKRNIERVRQLIEQEGANVSQRYSWSGNLISYGGSQNFPEIEKRNGCWTVLAAAIRTDNDALVELVVRYGADPNEPFWVVDGVGKFKLVRC